MTATVFPSVPTTPSAPREYRLLIDGRWVEGSSGVLERSSPAHGVVVSRYSTAGSVDVRAAVAAARRAFDHGPWPRLTGGERARLLAAVADRIEARADELAYVETLESGKPIAQARAEMGWAADLWRYASALARTLHGDSYNTIGEAVLGVVVREPVGVVSIITPWNFPFLIVGQKLPFALAAGCTAVVKPSEMTSGTTLILGEILMDAGLPPGVVNIVVGRGPEVGAPMVSDPEVDMLSFTGSTRVGQAAMAAAAATMKKVSFELGGKNPQLVFADADLDAAADAVVFGMQFNAGECCNSGSRLLVHRAIADDFVAEVVARSQRVPMGDPLDPTTKIGAIITPEHLGRIEGYVAGALQGGADVRLGGGRVANTPGLFMEPTVLTGVQPGMAVAREEIFGPVLSVLTFDDADAAIRLANDTPFGLSAAVWSRDIDTCLAAGQRLRAGTVWFNTFMDGCPELPFGGVKQSGLGRELGRAAVEEFTETKTLHMRRGPRTAWWADRRAV
ncbi:aldehyde dehydrogenase family protein [Azospirillum griseum]|uniref:Aldehyde dehydrogenase family protein n=1 Tax=Azospirillum griseum TaxID=2496639 RepID=A0A3S0HWJ1_9PROT|nr:aldehyde dehydrogenase family protein [Azospirillum griseum]RTR18852.1 aldehyde dehydrogenase family protein [Azospirillum griseum]